MRTEKLKHSQDCQYKENIPSPSPGASCQTHTQCFQCLMCCLFHCPLCHFCLMVLNKWSVGLIKSRIGAFSRGRHHLAAYFLSPSWISLVPLESFWCRSWFAVSDSCISVHSQHILQSKQQQVIWGLFYLPWVMLLMQHRSALPTHMLPERLKLWFKAERKAFSSLNIARLTGHIYFSVFYQRTSELLPCLISRQTKLRVNIVENLATREADVQS